MTSNEQKNPALNFSLIKNALLDSVLRLNPLDQIRSPILFVIYMGAVLSTLILFTSLFNSSSEPLGFMLSVTLILWVTVVIANLGEAIAQRLTEAGAAELQKANSSYTAKKLTNVNNKDSVVTLPASSLHKGDIVLVEAGDFIPADGIVIEGIATVDESAITGESAPVIRETNRERNIVTRGTLVLSDWILMEVTADHGESALDRLTQMTTKMKRQKTPNELTLEVFLVATTIALVIACATFYPLSLFYVEQAGTGEPTTLMILIGLFVCIAPTTIGGLLSPISISGMNRLMKANVVATSLRSVEAAGDISLLLFDKTGTITYGNRQAASIIPAPTVTHREIVKASLLASVADDTPEGRSIVDLAFKHYHMKPEALDKEAKIIPFSAETRMSGIITSQGTIVKGAQDVIELHVASQGGMIPKEVTQQVEMISRQGGTPLLVAENSKVLGVIQLKDIIKPGIKERMGYLRIMGIKSVMITGDNPLTAAAIAAEAGVDDFLAQASPEAKLSTIRKAQQNGEVVAMVGDGTNDAPALAQADVAVVMNNGSDAAKQASNMIDLDSSPTKLIDVVKIGKEILMTRGSLTTMSLANETSKFLAVIPAAFVGSYPALEKLNVLHLSSPENTVIAALVFNASALLLFIPLALKGVRYQAIKADALLLKNTLIYGVGGFAAPLIGIKLIDLVLVALLGQAGGP